ncbi:NlpC/P60 family protein [Clostridium perfringens]|uniref:C40 family peptidase n=1 Tax=Clostridium perfringens TaxID=1502 RepID=UPI000D713CA3|nr:NlpC/P60 family protein [Clostridium perfringens]PWW90792.1 cell wall-binding protein [Clostridium perfringens]PWX70039.1 cell wall-binding protein [Clostridium perfringens]
MEQEKQFIKKIFKYFFLSGTSFFIIFTLLLGSITMIIFQTKKSNSNGNINADLSALGVPMEFIPYYEEASKLTGIPNWVLAAITKQESNFRNIASSDGAYGVMQQQRYDFDGSDIYKYYLDLGLGDLYRSIGYSYNSVDEIWNVFLKDIRLQIITGAYETKHYANYVLWRKKLVPTLNYNSVENMALINWNADENDPTFRELLRRIFACYNGGPSYGMNVNLDTAQNNYPNNVFKYAMEFRNAGLIGGGIAGDNGTIENAINAGMKWVGKSPYVWGGGRNQSDIDAGRFDCSSFVHYCYASAGIQLGDRASAVTFSMVNMGKGVKPSEMKRGDLIFFDTYTKNGHIAIYLGNGEFLHDGTTHGVWINNLNEPYWTRTFNGNVRRIIE